MSLGALVHALQHGKVLKAHQLVFVRLADHATDSGLSWPSHSLLARETGYTRQYVIRVIADLLREGVMREVCDAKGRRRYQLHVYHTKTKTCTCEGEVSTGDTADCQLSLQAPRSTCKQSPDGVNSPTANSCSDKENVVEPLTEEPEKMHVRSHEAEDEEWRRRYDAMYGEPKPSVPKSEEDIMPAPEFECLDDACLWQGSGADVVSVDGRDVCPRCGQLVGQVCSDVEGVAGSVTLTSPCSRFLA